LAGKKKKQPEESGGGSFVVLFTSLSMILLAFFILLYSIAQDDSDKRKKALGSLVGSFGILPGGTRPDEGEAISVDEMFTVPEPEKVSAMYNDIATAFDAAEVRGAQLKRGVDSASATFPGEVFFEEGGLELTENAKSALTALTGFVERYDVDLHIEGHTAEGEPLPGPEWTAFGFSGARAAVIAAYLEEHVGIEGKRLKAVGLADLHPRETALAQFQRKLNRWVEIRLVEPDVDEA